MAKIFNENKGNESIPRNLIFDTTLSDRARFVYCYMSAKPEGWDFVLAPMAKELGYSVETLRKYIAELVESGWIIKGEQGYDKETGKFSNVDYTIKNSPSPCRKKPVSVKTRDGKNHTQDINSSINTPLNKDDIEKKCISKDTHQKNKIIISEEEKAFIEKMRERFPRIMRMEKPLTLEQAKKLKERYDTDMLYEMMQRIENWKPLIKNNVSAYQTIINWCDREEGKR